MPSSQPAVSCNRGKKFEKMGSSESFNKAIRDKFRTVALRRSFERRKLEKSAFSPKSQEGLVGLQPYHIFAWIIFLGLLDKYCDAQMHNNWGNSDPYSMLVSVGQIS